MAVYGPAIQENLIHPSTVIPIRNLLKPSRFDHGAPTNYGNVVSGGAGICLGLPSKSDNLPAVRVYQEMQNAQLMSWATWRKWALTLLPLYTRRRQELLALLLVGFGGPTVLEEILAFATFNNGNYS